MLELACTVHSSRPFWKLIEELWGSLVLLFPPLLVLPATQLFADLATYFVVLISGARTGHSTLESAASCPYGTLLQQILLFPAYFHSMFLCSPCLTLQLLVFKTHTLAPYILGFYNYAGGSECYFMPQIWRFLNCISIAAIVIINAV